MWDLITGRTHERALEQEAVDRALVAERAKQRQLLDDLDRQADALRTTDARMMRALSGAVSQASRAKRDHH